MSLAAHQDRMSAEEYLAFERSSDLRHELIDGELVAMNGGSRQHDTIAVNLLASLHARLRGGPCRPHSSDMRVKVTASGLYTYPDLSVVCGEAVVEDDEVDTLTNPTLLVEVLSPSTAAYDRGEKWERYRSIESLREFLLIEQERVHVEHFLRRDEGSWLFSEHAQRSETLDLESIGCRVRLDEIYESVDFSS